MENKEKAIKEIKNIKMSDTEKDQIFNRIVTTPVFKEHKKPIKSPFSISMFWNNSYAFYAAILCLVILGGGLVVISNQKNNTMSVAVNYKTNNDSQNLKTTTPQNQEISVNQLSQKEENTPNEDLTKKLALVPENGVTTTKKEVGSLSVSAPTSTSQPSISITPGLKKVFDQYKNGQISECTENGITYYSASENAYDAGGATYSTSGNVVGQYQGFTGKYTGINPKNCTRIYVVYPNIWGYTAVNKYNLK